VNKQRALALSSFVLHRVGNYEECLEYRCSVETASIINKNSEHMTDLQDVGIYLFFSRDGKLYWAAPQNLPDLSRWVLRVENPNLQRVQNNWRNRDYTNYHAAAKATVVDFWV